MEISRFSPGETYYRTNLQKIEEATSETIFNMEKELVKADFIFTLEHQFEWITKTLKASFSTSCSIDCPSSSLVLRKLPITLEKGKIKIDSKVMKVNVFYKIRNREEELVVRKLPDGKLEIFEVIE